MSRRPGSPARVLRVLLVDPSLFTAPYDAALSRGLVAAGIEPHWLVRPLRRHETPELPGERCEPMFYRRVDEAAALPARLRGPAKGLAHLAGLARLLGRVWRRPPDAVHVQWAVLPLADALAMRLMRLRTRVILTVHDTVPFNGETISRFQNFGFDLPIRMADGVVVHTEAGRDELLRRGHDARRIRVIPHGAMTLPFELPPRTPDAQARYTFVQFGEIKPYKGVDLLVEAIGRLPAPLRRRGRWIVAGRARMDLAPLRERIATLGLGDAIEIRDHRQSEAEMARLFADADAFVFPYRQIDASGVWYLTKPLGRWMVASAVGVFAVELPSLQRSGLVPAGDVEALARALADAIEHRRHGTAFAPGDEWRAIGEATRRLYLGEPPEAAAPGPVDGNAGPAGPMDGNAGPAGPT